MTAPQSVAADSRRRILLMVAAGVGLGLVLFVGGRLLSSGSSSDVAELGAGAPGSPTSTPSAGPPVAAAAPGEPGGTVETFEVFTTKNPFVPLRVVSAAPAGTPAQAPAAAGTAPAAAGTAPAAPSAPGSAATGPTAGATAGTAPATTTSGGLSNEPGRSTRVALLDVFAEGDRVVANVRVNDTVSKVGAGDTFSSNFKTVSLDPADRCGRFLYGDDQFRLCKGEEILK